MTRIEQLQDELSVGEKYYVDKIKGRTLTDFIHNEYPYEKKRSREYLKLALEGEWEYKPIWFKSENKMVKAWVRVTPKNIKLPENSTKKQYNPMDEFLVGLNNG